MRDARKNYSLTSPIFTALCLCLITMLLIPLNVWGNDRVDEKKMVEKGLDFLAKNVGNGYKMSQIWGTSIAGFAWMLNGTTPTSGPHKDALNRLTNQMLSFKLREAKDRTDESDNTGCFANWEHGFMLMYLSQIASLGEPQKVEMKIKELIRILGDSQFESGGWTHGYYGKNDLGYDTLVATTVIITHGLGMARQAGFIVPEKMIDKAFKYIQDSTSGPNVGYSPREGQVGMKNAGGRWAGAYASLVRFRREETDLFRGISPVDQYLTDAGTGHAEGMWHYLLVGLTAQYIGGDFYKKFKEQHISRIHKLQNADGSFSEIPRLGKEQDPSERGVLWFTAISCVLLSFDTSEKLIFNRFKMGTNQVVTVETLEYIKNILGEKSPESLKKLIVEANGIETKDDKNRQRIFEKLYKEQMPIVCADLAKLENKQLSEVALKRILGIEVGQVNVLRNKGKQPTWIIEGVVPTLMVDKAEGMLSFEFESKNKFMEIKALKFSIGSKGKYFKEKISLQKDDVYEAGKVIVTLELSWQGHILTERKKVELP